MVHKMTGSKVCRQFKFNRRLIERLPTPDRNSPSADQEYSDLETRGLKISVSKNGRKFFLHRYRFNKRRRSIRIGEFPAISLMAARLKVNENKWLLAEGIDPFEIRKNPRILTFEEYMETEFLPNYSKKKKKSWRNDLWIYKADLNKSFGKRPLSAIKKLDIIQYIGRIKDRTSGATANRHYYLLSKIFNVAIEWKFLTTGNPCLGIKRFEESSGRARSP